MLELWREHELCSRVDSDIKSCLCLYRWGLRHSVPEFLLCHSTLSHGVFERIVSKYCLAQHRCPINWHSIWGFSMRWCNCCLPPLLGSAVFGRTCRWWSTVEPLDVAGRANRGDRSPQQSPANTLEVMRHSEFGCCFSGAVHKCHPAYLSVVTHVHCPGLPAPSIPGACCP
jgi:hypothetical protein